MSGGVKGLLVIMVFRFLELIIIIFFLLRVIPSSAIITMRHNQPEWFDEDSYEAQAHDKVVQAEGHHKAQLSHELIAGAASYAAMKAYHNHCEKNGEPVSHAQAKEILAGLSGAFVDRIVETKGLDFIDREKAKRNAHEQLHDASKRGFPQADYDDNEFEEPKHHDYEQPHHASGHGFPQADYDDNEFEERSDKHDRHRHHDEHRKKHHHERRGSESD